MNPAERERMRRLIAVARAAQAQHFNDSLASTHEHSLLWPPMTEALDALRPDDLDDVPELATPEYRMLRKGEQILEGDEVRLVGGSEGDWIQTILTVVDDMRVEDIGITDLVFRRRVTAPDDLAAVPEPDASTGNVEFDKGYQDGLSGRGYRPSTLRYVQGYESGKLARSRLEPGS